MTLPTGQSRSVVAALCGVPRIAQNSTLKVFPSPALINLKASISDKALLLPNYRIDVTIRNDEKSIHLTVDRGTVVAVAVVSDAAKSVLPPRPRHIYCQVFLRHYCDVTGADFGGVAVCDDGKIRFGSNFDVSLSKNEKAIVKNPSTSYSLETVVAFLKHYRSGANAIKPFPAVSYDFP
jgi:hypothetical protein